MPISKQFQISPGKKTKKETITNSQNILKTYIHTVYTIKKEEARDLAATMEVSTTMASITEQRKPTETTAFEGRVCI